VPTIEAKKREVRNCVGGLNEKSKSTNGLVHLVPTKSQEARGKKLCRRTE